jgi:hypothetical protein
MSSPVDAQAVVSVRYAPSGELVSATLGGRLDVWASHGEWRERLRSLTTGHAPVTGIWLLERARNLGAERLRKLVLVGLERGQLGVHALPTLERVKAVALEQREGAAPLSPRPVLDRVVQVVTPPGSGKLFVFLESWRVAVVSEHDFTVTRYVALASAPVALVECAAASKTGSHVFIGDTFGRIHRVELEGLRMSRFGEHRDTVQFLGDEDRGGQMGEQATAIVALAVADDGKWLASSSRAGSVHVWSTAEPAPRKPSATRRSADGIWIRSLAFLGMSAPLALGYDDGTVEIWEYAGDPRVTRRLSLARGVRALEVSNDGAELAVACEDGRVHAVPVAPPRARGVWLRVWPWLFSGLGAALGVPASRELLTPLHIALLWGFVMPGSYALLTLRQMQGLPWLQNAAVGFLSVACATAARRLGPGAAFDAGTFEVLTTSLLSGLAVAGCFAFWPWLLEKLLLLFRLRLLRLGLQKVA